MLLLALEFERGRSLGRAHVGSLAHVGNGNLSWVLIGCWMEGRVQAGVKAVREDEREGILEGESKEGTGGGMSVWFIG